MNQLAQSFSASLWRWPINVATYGRTPELSADELKELRRKVRKKKKSVSFAHLGDPGPIGPSD